MDNREEIRASLALLRAEVEREDSDSPLRKTLLSKIDELKKDYEDVVIELNKPDDIRLAEYLHEKFCQYNHTDGCGWFYRSWTDMPLEYSRDKYLKKARRLLEKYTVNEVIEFVELIK